MNINERGNNTRVIGLHLFKYIIQSIKVTIGYGGDTPRKPRKWRVYKERFQMGHVPVSFELNHFPRERPRPPPQGNHHHMCLLGSEI